MFSALFLRSGAHRFLCLGIGFASHSFAGVFAPLKQSCNFGHRALVRIAFRQQSRSIAEVERATFAMALLFFWRCDVFEEKKKPLAAGGTQGCFGKKPADAALLLDESQVKSIKPDVLSPAEIEGKAEALAVGKAGMSLSTMFVLAIAAGMFIACGATLFTLVQGDADLPFAVKRVMGGVCFSVGLMLVVVCGSELFTGNCLMVCGMGSKKVSLSAMLKNWVVVWVGNFVGSLLIAGLVFGSQMGAMNTGAVGDAMVSIALSKVTPDMFTLFCKATLCNFLVCLAVWMTFGARTLVDKIVACVMPITAFVACGFEHSVANMFFLFEGLFAKYAGYGSNLAVSQLDLASIFCNLGVVTLGNIVGGSILVGLLYWFAYARNKA